MNELGGRLDHIAEQAISGARMPDVALIRHRGRARRRHQVAGALVFALMLVGLALSIPLRHELGVAGPASVATAGGGRQLPELPASMLTGAPGFATPTEATVEVVARASTKHNGEVRLVAYHHGTNVCTAVLRGQDVTYGCWMQGYPANAPSIGVNATGGAGGDQPALRECSSRHIGPGGRAPLGCSDQDSGLRRRRIRGLLLRR